jgi:hypothetical protein
MKNQLPSQCMPPGAVLRSNVCQLKGWSGASSQRECPSQTSGIVAAFFAFQSGKRGRNVVSTDEGNGLKGHTPIPQTLVLTKLLEAPTPSSSRYYVGVVVDVAIVLLVDALEEIVFVGVERTGTWNGHINIL